MRIDDVVVISLPGRTDRLQRFFADLPDKWPFPEPRVVDGVEAQRPPYWRVSSGAYGCMLAHTRVIETAFREGVKNLLVLEDDAMFVPDFAKRWRAMMLALPPQWSMLMLGGQHKEEPTPMGRLVRCHHTRRTHAYVIRDRAMPFVARTWRGATSHIDHLAPVIQSQAWVYAPSPFLVGQRAGASDISGLTHPDDRFWAEPADRLSPLPRLA